MRANPLGFLLAIVACSPAHADVPADLDLVPFATGLSSPLAVRHAGDGSGRVFVVERGGTVVAFAGNGTRIGNVLDIATIVSTAGEGGLLGLAFHPDFPADARLFVYYTDLNVDTVVASYTVSGNAAVAGSAQVLLRVDQDFNNHNGGDIHFGADGHLYIALGDGGGGGDPCGRAQTLDPDTLVGAASGGGGTGSGCAADNDFLAEGAFPGNADSRALLGKILRIDVDGSTAAGGNGLCGGSATGAAAYAIPAGNPYAGDPAGGCDEVWHYGLRNPYRFSFDRLTGDMFIGDVGQGSWEEIDFAAHLQGGLNFGWNLCEGDHPYPPGASGGCPVPGSTLPVIEYANAGAHCAVTGGYRYRGPITPLAGDYVYGDYCSGTIWIAAPVGAGWSTAAWRDTSHAISGFGQDEAGRLYLTDLNGQVLRFDSAQVDGIFADGFESP